MSEQQRPFSNGSEFLDWLARNCDRCDKGMRVDEWGDPAECPCPIEEALHSPNEDGYIEPEIAARMGYPEHAYHTSGVRYYTWDCPERVQADMPEYAPITLSNKDSEFLESQAFQVTEVCRWFRVPPLPGFEVAL